MGRPPTPGPPGAGPGSPTHQALISESGLGRSIDGPGYSLWLTQKSVGGWGLPRDQEGRLRDRGPPPSFHRRNGGPQGARDSPGSHCEPSCWTQGPGLSPTHDGPECPLNSDRVKPPDLHPQDSGLAVLS